MMNVRKAVVGGLGVAALLGFAALSSAVTSAILAVGTIPFLAATDGPATVTIQQLTVAPGEIVPWHYHTGEVWVVVKSGVLTEQAACGATEVHGSGAAFVEEAGVIHSVSNAGGDPVELYATYVTPSGAPRTVPVTSPVCIGPPVAADQCFDGNWQTFTVPGTFRNQGQCVAYVQSRRH